MSWLQRRACPGVVLQNGAICPILAVLYAAQTPVVVGPGLFLNTAWHA